MARMKREETELMEQNSENDKRIQKTEANQRRLFNMRKKEAAEFRQALKDDTDALSLLKQAIVALSKFYKKNKIPIPQLIQQPQHAEDPDKAPETSWSGSDYGGRQSE